MRPDPKYVELSFIWSKPLNWVLKLELLTGDGDFKRPQAHLMQKGDWNQAQITENQNFTCEAIGISCVPP